MANLPNMLAFVTGPYLMATLFPEPERESIKTINSALISLDMHVRNYWADLTLFDECGTSSEGLRARYKISKNENERIRSEMLSQWVLVAARDACMSIYHFGRARDGVNVTLGGCPTLQERFNRQKMSEANKTFDAYLPDYVKMRHAIAHSEETRNTVKAVKRHAIQESEGEFAPGLKFKADNGGKIMMGDSLFGRTFTSTWEGALVR